MRHASFLTILLVTGLYGGRQLHVHADVVSWLSDADGFWQVAANWSSNPSLPGPKDDVVIDVGGPTVRTITYAGGNSSVRSLFSREDLLLINGTLVAGNADVNAVLTVSGGTLANTTLTGSALRVLKFGAVDNVTLNSGVEFPNPFLDQLDVHNGLVLNGVTTLAGAVLNFAGTQALTGTAVIDIADQATIRISRGADRSPALTIGTDVRIRGFGHVGASLPGTSSTLINHGLMGGAVPGLTMNPRVFMNRGTLEASRGFLRITPTSMFTNEGSIIATDGSSVTVGVAGGTWSNAGTILLDNASLNLNGTFQTTSLSGARFKRSDGSLTIGGTLENSGATLDIGAVILSGVIHGGTVAGPIEVLSEFQSSPLLDGVTVNGGLIVPNGGALRIRNGMTLNCAVEVVAPATFSVFRFEGSQTLDGTGTFTFSPGSHTLLVDDGATLTIGPGIVLRGTSGHIGTVLLGQDSVVNQGTIRADAVGGMWVHSRLLQNAGTLEARNGGSLRLAEVGRTVISNGALVAGPGGVVLLGTGGSFSITGGTIILNNGTVEIRGVYTTANLQPDSVQHSGGTLLLAGTLNNQGAVLDLGPIWLSGRVNGGTVDSLLSATGSARLDGVTVNGRINVFNGLALSGDNTLNSEATLREQSSNIRIQGSSSLSGSGTVIFSHETAKLFVDGGSTWSIGSGISLRGFSNVLGQQSIGTSGDNVISNAGVISADDPAGSLTFASTSMNNSGRLEARAGGQLNALGAVTTSGTIEAESNGTILLGTPVVAQGGSIGGDGSVRSLGMVSIAGTVAKPGSGVLRVNGLLDLAPGQSLDLLNGSVVNDYTGPSPFNVIRARIITGYNNGSWHGTGVRSSTAAADPSFAVGYAEASELFTNFPATFMGETIDDTTVLVRLVRAGDADLNGVVGLDDFNRLAANFGSVTAFWDDGDFDYDGVVGLPDFNLLAGNFGLTASPNGPTPEDWANLVSAVPEPGTFAWVTLLAAAHYTRRYRLR